MRQDCCISWGYIVRKMEEKFGIEPSSDDEYAMCELEKCIDIIWNEFIDKDEDEVTERK